MLLPQTIVQLDPEYPIGCVQCKRPLILQVTTELKGDLPTTADVATFTLTATAVSCLLCGQSYPAAPST